MDCWDCPEVSEEAGWRAGRARGEGTGDTGSVRSPLNEKVDVRGGGLRMGGGEGAAHYQGLEGR